MVDFVLRLLDNNANIPGFGDGSGDNDGDGNDNEAAVFV